MPWTKGQSGNPSGRRAGTPNKALRESVEGLSIKAVNDLLMKFEELSNTDKVKVAQMALKHVLPTYKSIEVNSISDSFNVVLQQLDELTEAQHRELAKAITDKYNLN